VSSLFCVFEALPGLLPQLDDTLLPGEPRDHLPRFVCDSIGLQTRPRSLIPPKACVRVDPRVHDILHANCLRWL